MSRPILTKTSLQSGTWHGILRGSHRLPQLSVTHLGREVPGISVIETKEEGTWLVEVPIPAHLLSDGVQTVVISDEQTGRTLNSFSVIAGEALDDDLRAEIDLLRAELADISNLRQGKKSPAAQSGA